MSNLVDSFAASAEAAGFRVHRGEAPELPGAEVSEALYGLADTGSVVLAASPQEPRARSLLSECHVSLLREDRILRGLDELFAIVGRDLPSALAIVTGPSRSADIEQRLTIGVHGPGEVHVALLPPRKDTHHTTSFGSARGNASLSRDGGALSADRSGRTLFGTRHGRP